MLRSTTAKRVKPGTPGTKRLQERYGDKLLCVRYRIDPDTGRRFTAVELSIKERTEPPAKALGLQKRIVKISSNGNHGIFIIGKKYPYLAKYENAIMPTSR